MNIITEQKYGNRSMKIINKLKQVDEKLINEHDE